MAIRPIDEYPGRVGATSADYPNGSAVNRTGPGLQDGTPLDQKWVNDFFGFSAAAIERVGGTANGSPETAGLSQILDAILGAVLQMMGFDPYQHYASGLSITTRSQTVLHNGRVYWYTGTLPLTTSGTFEAGWRLVAAAVNGKSAEFDVVTANQYNGPVT